MTKAESVRNRASKVMGILMLLAGILLATALCQSADGDFSTGAHAAIYGRIK